MAKSNWTAGETYTHTDANALAAEVNAKPNQDTTYPVLTQTVADAGTETTARSITAAILKGAVQKWVTGSSSTAVTAIGQSLNKAATALAARTAIAAEQEGWQGTTAQYNALGTKEPNRAYWIED